MGLKQKEENINCQSNFFCLNVSQNMIYITGDTHGLIDFSKRSESFSKEKNSRKDYLIILGDVGLLWSEKADYQKSILLLALPFYI